MVASSRVLAKIRHILLGLGIVSMAIPLFAYGLNGRFMRMSGEDYCYAAVVREHGFWQAQLHSYMDSPPYSGNRYSLTLFSGIAGAFGPRINGVLPGAMIVLWVGATAIAVRQMAVLAERPLLLAEASLLATFLVFATLYQAPELAQVLYWRSGMLPYLAPLVANTILVGIVLVLARRRSAPAWAYAAIGLLAFSAGGFSETAVALQTGFIAMAYAATWAAHKSGASWASQALKLWGAALGGTALAMMVLIVSPGNLPRLTKLPTSPDALTILSASLRRAFSFIQDSLRGLPVPNAYTFALPALISFSHAWRKPNPAPGGTRRALVHLAIVSFATYTLIVLTMAPSAYAQSARPEPRAQVATRFAMVMGVAMLGWLVGRRAWPVLGRGQKAGPALILVTTLLLAGFWTYPLHASSKILAETLRFQRWAELWDVRDREIRGAKAQGILKLQVMELDHVIPRVGELSPNPDYWYNNCAETYYGVEEIRATLRGWDP